MKLRPLFLAMMTTMAIGGCAQDSAQSPSAAAGSFDRSGLGPDVVRGDDGTEVPESLFRYYSLNALQKPPEQLTPEEREAVIESLSRLELLAEAAVARGIATERTVAVELELQRMQHLARAMVNRFLQESPPTEAELRAEYDENLASLGNTQYKARHILVESREEADEIINELSGGADFVEIAERHADGPTGPDGGDLGWFTAESMVQPFAEAVAAMEVGSYSSEPVQTQFGWHVILLEDQRANQAPGLDAVRADMTNLVNQQKLEEFIQSLKENN